MGRQRTITLSDRPPVVLPDESDWPVVAQAVRTERLTRRGKDDVPLRPTVVAESRGGIHVRAHADGRVIVYATLIVDPRGEFGSEADRVVIRAGDLIEGVLSDRQPAVDAVTAVAQRMNAMTVADGRVPARLRPDWATLAWECIAAFPGEVI